MSLEIFFGIFVAYSLHSNAKGKFRHEMQYFVGHTKNLPSELAMMVVVDMSGNRSKQSKKSIEKRSMNNFITLTHNI